MPTTKKETTKKETTKKATPKTSNGAKPIPNDPNCKIIERVLMEYNGPDGDVVLPDGLVALAYNVFNGRNIHSIVVPEGVEIIFGRAFENNFDLVEAILPSTLRAMGDYCFADCQSLKHVTLGNNLKEISDSLFTECYELNNVVIPKTVKSIGAFAFKNCRNFTSIVIPDGVESIGYTSFVYCINLEYLYIPSSVTEIMDNHFGATPFGGCPKLTIHCPSGSFAEEYCKSHGIKYVTDSNPRAVSEYNTSNSISARNAQIQELKQAAEDLKVLSEVHSELTSLSNNLIEGQAAMSKVYKLNEQQEAREKAEKEEKKRRKAEAKAARKSENDIVNMYVILTIEKKLGKLDRSDKDFYETYEEDLPTLSKKGVIEARMDMLQKMEDESLCSQYIESFKQISVEDRFSVSTRSLFNLSDEPELGVKAKWAIENSKEWYLPSEYDEVSRLMNEDLANIRKQLDDQFISIDEAWKKFYTVRNFLQITITDKAADNSDLNKENSNFQVVIGSQLITLKISSKGSMVSLVAPVMNCLTWYWNVTVRDIWLAAIKNEIKDEREGANNGKQLANQAFEQICSKHTETKATYLNQNKSEGANNKNKQNSQKQSTESKSNTKTTFESRPTSSSASSSVPNTTTQQTKLAKKEKISGAPSLVMGILSAAFVGYSLLLIVVSFMFALFLCALGVIFGFVGKNKSKAYKKAAGNLLGKAKIGNILSTVGIVVGMLEIIVTVIYFIC